MYCTAVCRSFDVLSTVAYLLLIEDIVGPALVHCDWAHSMGP